MKATRRTRSALNFRAVFLIAALTACGSDKKEGSAGETPAGDALAQVKALFEEERFDEAQTQLEALQAKEGSTPRIALLLGHLATRSGKSDEALRIYRTTLKDHPEAHDVRLAAAAEMTRIGKTHWAIDELEEARKLGASDDLVALPLGIARGRDGELDLAAKEFDRAQAAGVSQDELDYNRAVIATQHEQYEEALSLLTGASERVPDSAPLLREIARVQLAISNRDGLGPDSDAFQSSMTSINRAIDLAPNDWRCYELLGDLYRAQDDLLGAKETYLRAMELGLNPPQVDEKYAAVETKLREMGLSGK